MKIVETRTKEYITPIKVIKTEGLIENADILIKDFEKQNFFRAKSLCTVNVGYSWGIIRVGSLLPTRFSFPHAILMRFNPNRIVAN